MTASQTATHAPCRAENASDLALSPTGEQRAAVAGGARRRATEQGQLFFDAPTVLDSSHYLGSIAGKSYEDDHGIVVCGSVSSRNLPRAWVELKRWCIVRPARANAGSMMWAGLKAWIRAEYPRATTVVSYSDPAVGHDGALYRACGWLWAPTWHRLRPPPSGGGSWDGVTRSEPKDRWVFPLTEDPSRADALALRDESIVRRMPWAAYVEPTWRRGVPRGGGGDYRRWRATAGAK